MGKNRIRWSALILTLMVITFLVLAPPRLLRGLGRHSQQRVQEDDRRIISLWNIDSWEGGVNSRTTWLAARAKEYERTHKGIYFDVRSYTPEQFAAVLDQEDDTLLPDMISFGTGIITQPERLLHPIVPNEDTKSGLVASARVGQVTYAQPFLMGGYGLILHESTEVTYAQVLADLKSYAREGKAAFTAGRGAYHSPALSVVIPDDGSLFGIGADGAAEKNMGKHLPAVAWQDFSDRQAQVLIASQRDIYRMQESKVFLANTGAGYTDMVQYLGIFRKTQGEKLLHCQAFIGEVVSVENQQKLSALWLFPAIKEVPGLYGENEALAALNRSLSGAMTVCPAFLSKGELDEAAAAAAAYLLGEPGAKERIEKFKLLCK